MRTLARMAAALSLLSLVSAASAAPRRWAIGEIRVEGDVDEAARALVEERTWRALSLALPTDALLAPHDAVAAALAATPTLRGCADDRCSLQLGDRLAVERLITVRIERRGDGWTAHLLSFAVDAAQVAGTLELPCPGCSADALMDNFARAAAPLLRDERDRPLCTLSVLAPAGAQVSVDTVALADAPFAHTVAAGRHTIAAAGAYAEIDCAAGSARTVTLDAASATAGSRRPLELGLGATSAVLAAGSLAVLVTAAAYDQRAACSGRCGYRYDTTVGIALGAVGVVVFTAGAIALMVTARKAPRPVARATPDRAEAATPASAPSRALPSRAACGTEASRAACGTEASLAGRGAEASLAAHTSEVSLAARGEEASLGTRNTEASLAARGAEESLAARSAEASLAAPGGESSLGPRGAEASLPGRGAEASLPGRGAEASLPGRGAEASLPGGGAEASLGPRRAEASLARRGPAVSPAARGAEASLAPRCAEASLAARGAEASLRACDAEASLAARAAEALRGRRRARPAPATSSARSSRDASGVESSLVPRVAPPSAASSPRLPARDCAPPSTAPAASSAIAFIRSF